MMCNYCDLNLSTSCLRILQLQQDICDHVHVGVWNIFDVHVSCQAAEGALTFIIARLVCKYDGNGHACK